MNTKRTLIHAGLVSLTLALSSGCSGPGIEDPGTQPPEAPGAPAGMDMGGMPDPPAGMDMGGAPPQETLTVVRSGSGTGLVRSIPGGIDCGGACAAGFSRGTQVQLQANQDGSSYFAGWTGACAGTGPCTVTMDRPQQVTATFVPRRLVTIARVGSGAGRVTSAPAAIDCGTVCSATLPAETTLRLSAAADPASVFVEWGGACSGAGSACDLTVGASNAVSAAFRLSWEKTSGMAALGGQLFITRDTRLYLAAPGDGGHSVLGAGNWTGTEGVTAYDSRLYIVQNKRLHRVNPADGSYVLVGPSDWGGTQGMTAYDDRLYISQVGRLHRVNPADGSYVYVGSANWAGTEGMTAYDDRLYIVQAGRLHRVNPADGSYVYIGSANWAGTQGMVTYDNRLYIVQAGRLHRVNPADGSYVYVGSASWIGTQAMTVLNDRLYIVQADRLHRVNPTDGSYEILSSPAR